MKILMVFGAPEELRAWMREQVSTGRTSLVTQRISWEEGSIVCASVRTKEDCERLAGQCFDLVLYHKSAQASPEIREWLLMLVRHHTRG